MRSKLQKYSQILGFSKNKKPTQSIGTIIKKCNAGQDWPGNIPVLGITWSGKFRYFPSGKYYWHLNGKYKFKFFIWFIRRHSSAPICRMIMSTCQIFVDLALIHVFKDSTWKRFHSQLMPSSWLHIFLCFVFHCLHPNRYDFPENTSN